MSYDNPPPYPGPTAPYPPYAQQPGAPPGPYPGYPPGPYQPGQPGYQGYPQYGWQNAPPPPPGPVYGDGPKNTGMAEHLQTLLFVSQEHTLTLKGCVHQHLMALEEVETPLKWGFCLWRVFIFYFAVVSLAVLSGCWRILLNILTTQANPYAVVVAQTLDLPQLIPLVSWLISFNRRLHS